MNYTIAVNFSAFTRLIGIHSPKSNLVTSIIQKAGIDEGE